MARDRSPKCKQCRREGMKLFLKGERCLTEKCAIERRSYPPGEHGRGRIKQSEYLLQLREKQKARRYYGLLETQFRTYYEKATRQGGVTGENLLRMLETRLDNVVYRLGFAASRAQARQLVRHGHFFVNGRRVNIPSYGVTPDDVVTLKTGSTAEQIVRDATDLTAAVAPWLQADHEGLTGKVLKWPERDEIDTPVAGTADRRALQQVAETARPAGWLAETGERINLAARSTVMDFQVPKITHEEVKEHRGVFVIEPLDRGFGYTFGNSLRRVLLSSLEGAAVTSVKIEGVAHEFTTLPGVREDVTDILLNLKQLVCILHGESPEVEVRLTAKGEGTDHGRRHRGPADLEILNPELEIANLSSKGRLEITLTIGRGRGYVPAEGNRGQAHTIGVIPVDSMFSPIRRVAYDVEAARVGQRTDYDKLILDVTTNGSIDPKDAIAQAAEILIRQLAIFTDLDKIEGFGAEATAARRRRDGRRLARARDGELPDRGARARRPLVQLPQARRHRDDRRSRDEDRERAGLDPELRQEVDRGGQGDARPARAAAPRRQRRAQRCGALGRFGGTDRCAISGQARSSAATRLTGGRSTRT